jgi:glycosyltransferase 2 family protein
LIDRVVGLSAFALMALLATAVGKVVGIKTPDYLFWFFLGLSFLILVFYGLVFTIDFEKRLGKWPIFRKILDVLDVFKEGNKKRILLALGISVIAEPIWILPVWFYSLIFGAGMSWLSIMIILPIINLIIVLPISFAGFGARENLYLFFFSQLGISEEKILLVSTFSGIIVILNALLGGLISLI